jgi:hypothetical protein
MSAPSLLFTSGEWVVAFAASAWSLLTIARAVRKRPPELLVARCRACSYPVPTEGQTERCPECGKSLAGSGTVSAEEGEKPPPGRTRIFIACVLLVGVVWAFASALADRFFPVVATLRWTSQDRYEVHARRGFTDDSYSASFEATRDGPWQGPPDGGTLVVTIAGHAPAPPSATFDLVTGKLLSTTGASAHPPDISAGTQDAVTALFDSANLALDDGNRRLDAEYFARVTDSYLQAAKLSAARPSINRTRLKDGFTFSQHSSSSSSPLYSYRQVLGKRIDRDLLKCIAFVLGLSIILLLHSIVSLRARKARSAEWLLLRAGRSKEPLA